MTRRLLTCAASAFLALAAGISANAQSAYSNAVMTLNPVAYWPLTETTPPPPGNNVATNLGTLREAGNGLYESWFQTFGSSQALLPTNNIAHVAGPIGDGDMALQCGGLGQYVVLPRFTNGVANSALTLTPPFSLEIWANSGNTNLGLQPMITEGRNPVQGDAGIGYQSADAGFSFGMFKNFYYFTVFNTNGTAAQREIDIKPIQPNVWYHLVVTFDGNNEIQYSNGVVAASFNITAVNGVGLTYVPDQVSPLVIGVGTEPGGANGGNQSFQGMIDEVAIYNSVLSQTQISNHFAAATGTNYSQTVLADSPAIYLRLDEPSFTAPAPATYPVAANYGLIGANANGVYQPGTAPGIAGPPYSGFGSPSHAVAINGFNAGVDVGGGNVPPELNPTNQTPFTVMTWFRGNPADARGRFQDIMGHSDAAWRLTMDNVSSGNRFNPGNGPELQFANVSDAVTNGMLLNDGNWHMAAGVSDGTNDSLYLDGLLVKSGASVGAITGSLRDVVLGGDPQYTVPANRFFDGNIAHAAFFTNALTAGQIQQLYSAAGAPPVIHLQPTNSQSIYFAGTNALLATTVSGSSPLSLQWYQDGAQVTGQTSANLAYTPVLTNNAGSYYLVASNAAGSVTSAVVQLVVYGTPVIQQEPGTNVQVFAGLNPTLSVSALGTPPLFYFWSLNGGTINGATNSSLTITNAQTAGTYSCIVSNSYGVTPINPVSVTVVPHPTAPYPVAVLGDHPMAYWRLNEPFDQSNPNGGGDTAFDYVGANNGQYVGTVNLSGSQGYNLATDPTEQAPDFGGYPSGIFVNDSYVGKIPINFATNANAEFSVEAWVFGNLSSYPGPIPDGGIISKGYGSGGEQFNLDIGGSDPAHKFRFFVRDTSGNTHAINASVAPDGNWHHVAAVCDEANSNIWLYVDGVSQGRASISPTNGLLNSTFPIAIGSRPAGNYLTPYDNQFYGVIDEVAVYNYPLSAAQVLNHFNSAGIAPFNVRVQPSNLSTNQGATAKFTASVQGTPPLSYLWSDPSSAPMPGQTNATLTLTNVQQSQAGTYTVTITNLYGGTVGSATLTVDLGPPNLVQDLQPTNLTAYIGDSNTFTVQVSGSAPFSYQWFQDGARVPGATNASYSFGVLSGTNTYFCSITNAFSQSQSGGPTLSSTGTVVGIVAPTLSPADYTYRMKIAFTGYNRGETLTNFPALVKLGTNLPAFAVSQFASASGGDLRFTDPSGTRMIPHEIDEWSPATVSSVWVQVPRLLGTNDPASGTNNFIWAYWGNPAGTTPPAWTTNGVVWVPSLLGLSGTGQPFELVYHLKEGAYPFADSTTQHPALTGSTTAPAATPGIVGTGSAFDGGTTFLDAGVVNLGDDFTLSAWVNVATTVHDIQTIWANQQGGFGSAGIAEFVNSYQTSNGRILMDAGNGTSGSEVATPANSVSFGQWHLLSTTVDRPSGSVEFYVDGIDIQSASIRNDFINQADLNLGRFTNGFFYFTGTLDEARIQAGTNSANYIWASWMTVAQNQAFATYSSIISSAVTLNFQVSGGNLILTWPQGTLQSASTVNGQYSNMTGITSPYTNAITGSQQFFRVKVH